MPLDPKQLPRDVVTLQKIVLDLAEQLDRSLTEQNKYQSLLRELLEAQHNRKSEQLSKEQLALFEAAWKAENEAASRTPTTAMTIWTALPDNHQGIRPAKRRRADASRWRAT